MKKLIFVLGPETTGTRFWTGLFVQAGCFGKGSDVQDLISLMQESNLDHVQTAVWRYSYPMGDIWPDLDEIIGIAKKAGFDQFQAAITHRDWLCISRFDLKRFNRLQQAYLQIYRNLEKFNIPFTHLNYESAIHYGSTYAQDILKFYDLTLDDNVEIRDGNKRHYEGRKV